MRLKSALILEEGVFLRLDLSMPRPQRIVSSWVGAGRGGDRGM